MMAPARPDVQPRGQAMRVRPYQDADWDEWLRMSAELFPNEPAGEIAAGMHAFRSRFDAAVFVAERPDGGLAGFVEAGTRAYADGCETSPVGYLEAWYVDPDARGAGVGRALVAAAEAWASARGFREMASDALLENEGSHRAHRAIGYAEVERHVLFRRALTPISDSGAAAASEHSAADNCVFCRILAGELPGSVVYRDEQCAAFMDIQPVNPGHLLVVPLRHVAELSELDPLVAARMFQVAQRRERHSVRGCESVSRRWRGSDAGGLSRPPARVPALSRRRLRTALRARVHEASAASSTRGRGVANSFRARTALTFDRRARY
ncbi:MAG TPA: GNAT family N-acetyltransferase [Gemmatimonadaceae bacterium]|nr:GNAT family N-acetyltransferase [Gemmatimonadaceae bacterium]